MLNHLDFSNIAATESTVKLFPEAISLARGTLHAGGISRAIKEHMKHLLSSDTTDYYEATAGIEPLRQKIATNLDANLQTNHILVTHGAMGALTVVTHTVLKAGDEVIIPEPTYPIYHQALQHRGININWVSVLDNNGSIIDDSRWFEHITRAYTAKTKALILANPGNPLGTVISKATLEKLIDWCEQHQVYLILDEVYRHYIYHGTHTSGADYVATHQFVIMIDSFSKSYAMSGWRIGYLAAPQQLIPTLSHTQHIIFNCTSTFAQYAALYALDHPECHTSLYTLLKKNHALVKHYAPQLAKRGMRCLIPDGGFFVLVQTDKPATSASHDILVHNNVGLVPGSLFGPSGSHCVRLCFARSYVQLKTALDRLAQEPHVSS